MVANNAATKASILVFNFEFIFIVFNRDFYIVTDIGIACSIFTGIDCGSIRRGNGKRKINPIGVFSFIVIAASRRKAIIDWKTARNNIIDCKTERVWVV